jgi:beta-alanine degradation protein BauB
MAADPTESDPDNYKVVFENERVRVREFARLIHGDQHRDVKLEAGRVNWLSAQEHSGENIGDTETHVLFVELKEAGSPDGIGELGPSER